MTGGNHVLITGGAGFIGSNLADSLMSDGERVLVLDNLTRRGVVRNLEWLRSKHGPLLEFERGDVTDQRLVGRLVSGARAVYHFAAQVAVTTSVQDPYEDLRTNLLGTFNVLEAARRRRVPPPVVYTSTNKVYGELTHLRVEHDRDRYVFAERPQGISEGEPLDFHSPYGCSKGAADQYVRDYWRIYGVPTVVLRMSCIYGRRQWGTEDQGWVAHFGRALLRGEAITVFGDGHQVRDILWIDDLVAALRGCVEHIDGTRGQVFNIGGGHENAVTVMEVIERLAQLAQAPPEMSFGEWRPGDQRVYVTDHEKASLTWGWRPRVSIQRGLARLVEWLDTIESTIAPHAPRSFTTMSMAARNAGAP